MTRTNPIIIVTFLALLAPATGWAQKTDSAARWEATIEKFEQQDQTSPPEKGAVLFVGSSSIRLWDTRKWFPEHETLNRGFGGSQISDVLQYADRIVWKYQPRVIVFYAGDNDVATGKSPERVFEDFRRFGEQAERLLPESHLVYLPIKPSLARWKLWPVMSQANERIKEWIGRHERFHYADIATPMLGDDGKPRSDLFRADGLHLNDEGYRLWSGIVEKVLATIGEKTGT